MCRCFPKPKVRQSAASGICTPTRVTVILSIVFLVDTECNTFRIVLIVTTGFVYVTTRANMAK